MKRSTLSPDSANVRARKWLWFAALYVGGVLAVAVLSYALRALVIF